MMKPDDDADGFEETHADATDAADATPRGRGLGARRLAIGPEGAANREEAV